MNIWIEGALIGAGLAAVLIIFEYMAISREVAARSKKAAKKIEWDSSQHSRLRNMVRFGIMLPIGFAVGAWLVFG